MKTTTMNMFIAMAMAMTTGMMERVSSAEPPAGTGNSVVQRRAIDKKVSDFLDRPDLSTPEAACAAWQRASARKDAQAISQLSWIPLDPAQLENQYRRQEARDAEGFAIYLKALAESKIVEVQIWRNELAQVITHLPFPAGKGQSPFSARTFGRIKGQWKNLGEERLPTLEAARENFTRKKDALWQRFETIRKNQRATATPAPWEARTALAHPNLRIERGSDEEQLALHWREENITKTVHLDRGQETEWEVLTETHNPPEEPHHAWNYSHPEFSNRICSFDRLRQALR